jgi:hypothetical protein
VSRVIGLWLAHDLMRLHENLDGRDTTSPRYFRRDDGLTKLGNIGPLDLRAT